MSATLDISIRRLSLQSATLCPIMRSAIHSDRYIIIEEDDRPSFLQLRQISGALSGHSAAGCPGCSQIRQVPVNLRGLGQSALEWLPKCQHTVGNRAPRVQPFFAAVEASTIAASLAWLRTVTSEMTLSFAAVYDGEHVEILDGKAPYLRQVLSPPAPPASSPIIRASPPE